MHTIFEALRRDHEVQRALINRLVESGATNERVACFAEFKAALQAHMKLEEHHFYGPLLLDERSRGTARRSMAEHMELHELLDMLSRYDFGAAQWIQTARDLEHRLERHLSEEENDVFQVARAVLTAEQENGIACCYDEQMLATRVPAAC